MRTRRYKCPSPQPFTTTSHYLATIFLTENPSRLLLLKVIYLRRCDMGDQSGSTRFRAPFESALEAYEKKTGITLAEHPLALQLQSCHSVEDITTLVQDQASAFGEFRGKDRIMKSIKSTASILATLSATASFGDAIGLVRHKGADDGHVSCVLHL